MAVNQSLRDLPRHRAGEQSAAEEGQEEGRQEAFPCPLAEADWGGSEKRARERAKGCWAAESRRREGGDNEGDWGWKLLVAYAPPAAFTISHSNSRTTPKFGL